MAIVVDGGWEMVGISTSISRSDLTETLGDSERFLRRTSDAAHHLDPRGCCDLRTKKIRTLRGAQGGLSNYLPDF